MKTALSIAKYFSCLLIALLTIKVSFGQSNPGEINKIMTAYNKNGQFNGLVLVAENGKIIYEKAFGKAIYEWNIDNTLQTKMEVASITKTFTALMVMQLIQQGKISLDGKVSDYLTAYPRESGTKITIDQLLRHSSGLQQDIGDFPPNTNNFPDIVAKINEEFFSLSEQVDIISKRPLLFEPGTNYSYSSDGYAVLGLIIEQVTGLSYEDALKRLIAEPLQLSNTGYKDHLAVINKKAQGYAKSFSGISRGRQIGISPAGGIYSTIHDLFKWEQSLYTEKLINEKSKKIIFTKTPYLVGYGWQIDNNYFKTAADSIKMVRCTGSLPGFNSLVVRFPGQNKTIIVMENLKQPYYRQFEIVHTVAAALFHKPYTLPKPSLAEKIVQAFTSQGIKAALAIYDENKKTNAYYINEAEINGVGYYFLNMLRDIDNAIIIFKLNTELFPASANVYDSLGEGYMKKGDKENAVKFYQKSLQLDPANSNAKQMLEKLLK
jgi:CubicO group peptidase (beta-lactamase class C family)